MSIGGAFVVADATWEALPRRACCTWICCIAPHSLSEKFVLITMPIPGPRVVTASARLAPPTCRNPEIPASPTGRVLKRASVDIAAGDSESGGDRLGAVFTKDGWDNTWREL